MHLVKVMRSIRSSQRVPDFSGSIQEKCASGFLGAPSPQIQQSIQKTSLS
jgi:hypothetical protein